MSATMQELPPDPPNDEDGGPECERCEEIAPAGREIPPESTEGAALNISEPTWLCSDCLSSLEEILAGWNR